ncbi:TlpA disulfide reductase family protein [Sphingobacterium sp. UT-1RO-CII-1]|uniref:TlpA family protein disulfide reductase n=1 Tax=Sphingobacterium sp. UT-1RO-CII-1 TaxID=2995225 RepID=UPI00227BE4BA|nr:TlpA disulfide reductase family protein [Sphingobacterium sp. UT-1RO-CII-1]MCY4780472.1 TlpA disulfide reductase family protein [Sphingobacterium sp. UT-1RO-CII-1]
MEDKKWGRWIGNTIFFGLVIMLLIPTTRTWMQQGLMKLGLFKPSLEAPVVEGKEGEGELKIGEDVVFLNDNEQRVPLADLKGKVVFINFWATWCPPCKAEMPSIQVLKDKFKDNKNVEFMLVEIDGEKEKANTFMKKGKMDLPIYYPDSSIPREWLGGSIPTTVILDKEGNTVAHHAGMADYSKKEVFDFITELINK